jgi:hypothetical protein
VAASQDHGGPRPPASTPIRAAQASGAPGATEFLAGGTVLALAAFACIMVPVRPATASRADGRAPPPRALR